jgi:DNA-binding PadR family transcriptional regulator
MPQRRAGDIRLPATAWAVLGLLSFGRELSGYDLKKWADASLRFFYWSPASSQIYSELRRLEGLGYTRSRTARQDDLRNKRMYRITSAGERALRAWIAHGDYEPTMVKHPMLMRVWLGHLAEPDRLRELVGEHLRAVQEELEHARYSYEHAPDDPAWSYPELVTAWAVRTLEAEVQLTEQLLGELHQLDRKRRAQQRRRKV